MFYKNPSVVFTETPAYKKIKSFIESINLTILNTVPDQCGTSHHTDATVSDNTLEKHDNKTAVSPGPDYSNFMRDDLVLPALKDIRSIVEDTPIGSPGRYANLGMVNVLDKIKNKFGESGEFHNQPSSTHQISDNNSPEHSTPTDEQPFNYLTESFGNRTRMDYGTGHELNFICYLYTKVHDTAEAVDELNISDSQLLFLLVNIDEYLVIVRRFIQKFNVEPAGARGCWAVSDYSLIGHLFGSAIEYVKETILASHVHSRSFGKENCVLASLIVDTFGNMLKETVGPNPNVMLIKILKLPRVLQNKGFKTMYDKEVFRRNVVTQHFIYSEYLSD